MKRIAVCLGGALVASAGCGEGVSDPTSHTVEFKMVVGDAAFSCAESFEGLGRGDGSTWAPTDARMYIHGIELVNADGDAVALTLEDNAWQHDGVVLLDFEDASGTCSNGTPQLNGTVTGSTEEPFEYTKVRFSLGVPSTLNHADQAVAASPLNITGMWWSWQGGYKFLKLDGSVTGADGESSPRLFHLGSTVCEPEGDSYACANPNRPSFEVAATKADTISFDLAALFTGAHLDADEGGAPGCMSGADDPDCAPLFGNLGISGESDVEVFGVK